ncbi:hypothetical protein [Lapidilactobacillus salsurivasis]
MKKIVFVLYASYQSLGYANLASPFDKKLSQELHQVFDDEYEIGFDPDTAESLDALVVPDQIANFDNKKQLPEIKVPATLFVTGQVGKIKEIVDAYFQHQNQ